MPATGRLYDPGAPTALEAALAAQVGTGQSPFAGALLTGYGLQRQQNVAAVNEAQAQSHLLDLANALRQQQMQSASSLAGAGLSSGRGIGPTLGAANSVLGLGMDQGQISDAGAQADLANSLNMAKTGAETANLGSEAGGGVADVSPVLQGLGFGITPTGTPRGVQQSKISADATIEAAKINAASRIAAAGKKGSGTGKPPKSQVTMTLPSGKTWTGDMPIDSLSPEDQAVVAQGVKDLSTTAQHEATGSITPPGGDPNTKDPALATQLAYLAKAYPGWTPVGGHGDPRDGHDPDGTPTRTFLLTDANGVTKEATLRPKKR
jgi:hypothetical protein